MYKNFFQIFILGLTVIIGFSGITNQFNLSKAEAKSLFLMKNEDLSSVDKTTNIENNINEFYTSEEKYVVQSGDTLESIARKIVEKEKEIYGDSIDVSADRVKRKLDTIKYTNNLFTANPVLKVGQTLTVFVGIDGLIYKVVKNDTIKKIAAKFNVNELDLVDTNIRNLEANLGEDLLNIPLEVGSSLFVPVNDLSKEIQDKTNEQISKNKPAVVNKPYKPQPQYYPANGLASPAGSDCGSLSWSRGYSNAHHGVDVTRGGGCTIVAMDSGTVIQARWTTGGGGLQVVIDHGNGYVTQYSHLARINTENASEGMKINKGTALGFMGSTGNAFGIHLHLSVYYNNQSINPENAITKCQIMKSC